MIFINNVYTRMNKTVLPMGYLCWKKRIQMLPFCPFVLCLYRSFNKFGVATCNHGESSATAASIWLIIVYSYLFVRPAIM